MHKNKGFTMQLKNDKGNYISLYPKTTKSQVNDWNIGQIINFKNIVIKSKDWVRNTQIINFDGISTTDRLYCLKVLTGTKEEMIEQQNNFDFITSIESLNNKVKFTCSSIPNVDIKVQIWETK